MPLADLLPVFAGFGAGATAAVPLLLRTSARRRRERRHAAREGHVPAAAGPQAEVHGWTPPELGPRRTVPLLEVPAPRSAVRFPLGQLAGALDRGRRRSTAESVLAHELDGLPISQWLIERAVRVGDRVAPFVVVGPTGVFVIGATDASWTMAELVALASVGAELTREIDGRDRPRVEAGICLALESQSPRAWYGGSEHGGKGGWVMGVDCVLAWLTSFDTAQHGIPLSEIERLEIEAGPHWGRERPPRQSAPGRG